MFFPRLSSSSINFPISSFGFVSQMCEGSRASVSPRLTASLWKCSISTACIQWCYHLKLVGRLKVWDRTVKAYDNASVGTCRSFIGFVLDTAFNACTWSTNEICYSDSMDVLWWIRVMGGAFIPLWLIVSERINGDSDMEVATFTDRRTSSWSMNMGSSSRRAIRELILVA